MSSFSDSGPENLTIAARYDNGVRLKWKLSPTCYERTNIIVMFISPSGKVLRFEVKQDAEWVDLTGLDPETNYNMTFVTEYGSQFSDPVVQGFRTLESRSALASGALAAIITGNTKVSWIESNNSFEINKCHFPILNNWLFSDSFFAGNHSRWGGYVENWEVGCSQTRNSKENDSSQGEDSEPFFLCRICKSNSFMFYISFFYYF